MKLKHLFSINIFFAVFFGLTCVLFARWSISLYGLAPDVVSIWVTRLVGGSILGYASLMWYGRQAESVKARRAIALALLIQDSIGAIASFDIQLKGIKNALGWLDVGLYGVLALGYAYFLFFKPEAS